MSAWVYLFVAICNFLSAVISALGAATDPNKALLCVLWLVSGLLMVSAYISKRHEPKGT